MTRHPLSLLLLLAWPLAARAADDFERPPIAYSKTAPKNAVSRLQERIDAAQVGLSFDDRHGYLPGLLKELGVPVSSQVLVFSKTSLQRHRISPTTPRAIYFSDDHYIGYCQDGAVLEISTADPDLGAVFYTLEQEKADKPRLVRQTDSCLQCHAGSHTRSVPGHLVRSIYPDREGNPILSSGSFRIDHTSPFEHRWGGWYVTGTHGKQMHLGNIVLKGTREPSPEKLAKLGGLNCTSLGKYIDASTYPSPHSDIVALMVLEHQAETHNQLTRANFLTRQAVHQDEELNRELKRDLGTYSDSTYRRIWSAADPLVRYLLMGGEAKLTDAVVGTSTFARDFAAQGPRDAQGRSLRDLDLKTRLFKYPCSYLIYSPAFDNLHPELKSYVLRRLHYVLTGRIGGREFDHLTAQDRQAILEILRATIPGLPAVLARRGVRGMKG